MQISLSRRGFLALGAGVTAASLSGCDAGPAAPPAVSGGSSMAYRGPSLTLTYWNGFTGADGLAMAALVKEFNDSQAHLTVDSRTYPWGAFYPNLRDLTNRGLGPDIGVMQADHLATAAAFRLLAPLDGVAEAVGLRATDFIPQSWDLGTYRGARYGIPLDVHCLAMFYNEDHFEKAGITAPPTSADSFDEACRRLRQAGYTYPSWMPSGWPALEIFLGLLRQNGGEPYNAEVSAATFHSDAGVASLMWMVDQVEKGYSPPVVADHWQEFTGPLRRNTIEFNGIWQIGDVGAAGLHYRVAPLPTIGERTAMWANSHQFFMSKAAAKHEHRLHASQVFLDFLSRQSSAWSAAGMIPARNSERGVGMYRTSKQYVLDGYLEEMHFAPSVAGLPSVTRATLGAVVPAVIGERMSARDARAALEKAAADANRLLKDNRRAWGS